MMSIIEHIFPAMQGCSGPCGMSPRADRDLVSQEDCLEEVKPELSFEEPLCPGRFRTGPSVSSGGNDSNNNKSCCVSELWLGARHPCNPSDIPRR